MMIIKKMKIEVKFKGISCILWNNTRHIINEKIYAHWKELDILSLEANMFLNVSQFYYKSW